MKKYLIFDLDGTLIDTSTKITDHILNFIKIHEPEYFEQARYVIFGCTGLSLKAILKKIFGDENKAEKYTHEIYEILGTLRGDVSFFPGAQKIIQELSKDYTLFLSTGSSDNFAKDILQQGGLYDCFEMILGSSNILKGEEHLELFQERTADKDFYKKAVYIGDGNMDRIFAKSKEIDFIHIGNDKKDQYEIENVAEISKVLHVLT